MRPIVVKGIDRDNESRSLSIECLPPDVLAEDLYLAGWKYAQLTQGGEVVGVVEMDPCLMHRTWWGKPRAAA